MGSTARKLEEVKESKKINVLKETSELSGFAGLVESLLRRFRMAFVAVLIVPVFAICCLAIGISLLPAIYFFKFIEASTHQWPEVLYYLSLGTTVAVGFLIYGFTLVFVLPFFNFINPFKVKEFRGMWFSIESIPWYYHNALTYVARYTFLDFITPTPLNLLFYKMMGMKVGKGVVINTSNISDPCMITLGDYVTIGGSATILGHYGQKGFLVIKKVVIGKGTTVGLKASIMGGVVIGQKCVIMPHATLLPKTQLKDGERV